MTTAAAATLDGPGSAMAALNAPTAKRPSLRLRRETCNAAPPWQSAPATPLPAWLARGPWLPVLRDYPHERLNASHRQAPAGAIFVIAPAWLAATAYTFCRVPSAGQRQMPRSLPNPTRAPSPRG